MNFPLELRFKPIAIAPQISVTDASGTLLLYVKQKAFKLKEAVTVFADAAQTRPLYRIAADRVLDVSVRYRIDHEDGRPLGVLERKGIRSLWRADYEVQRGGVPALTIREENPWVKVVDRLLGEVPVLGFLSHLLFHPAYVVARVGGARPVLRAVKRPALLESRFTIQETERMPPDDETLALLALLMFVLRERWRG
ncbi:MAG TPA: hypothetical protein VKA21_02050 [Candidatus Binatia bacterium]|nr:hypothetical protein [Candidatus Binatia bacterium]